MRIPSFEVQNQRGLVFAKCDTVPRLMIIAGPNGAGKSTLLYSLRNIGGRQQVLYIGPHRATRRQQVRQRFLISTTFNYEESLSKDDTPRYEGVEMYGGGRDPWSNDDSANYLKHSLCQIEVERQQAISARYDREGHIAKDSIVDPWQPLRELTHNLLPHLHFSRIDNENRDSIRCLWQVHTRDTEVDYDDLSSGEKSIVQMFYPLIEHRIRALLREIQTGEVAAARQAVCVLIDEPELHLHPNLQMKVFDYLRVLTAEGDTQVVVASHSPTIVEHATFEELFLLRPFELLQSGENQLTQVATDEERLQLMRQLFGTTSNITAMQPIIVVEGTSEEKASSVMPDRKLFRVLHPRFDSVVVVPGGGVSECHRLVGALNAILPAMSPRLSAIALVDGDLGGQDADGIYRLPVSMIENFILDPLPIWEAIQSVVEKCGWTTIEDVDAALTTLMNDLEGAEEDRRAKSLLGYEYFRPSSPAIEAAIQAERFAQALVMKYSAPSVEAALATATQQVQDLRVAHRRREHFHGKDAVNEFYRRHLHRTGLAKNVFKFEAMRHAKHRRSVAIFFESFFSELDRRLGNKAGA